MKIKFPFSTPSNNRDFATGFEKLAKVTIEGDLVKVSDIRDFHYTAGKIVIPKYLDLNFDINKITKVWFIFQPLWGLKSIAHCFFIFDFANLQPVAISVEARCEKGESYSPFRGLFNQYELMYVWSTQTDQLIKRIVLQNNQVFMFPLEISKEWTQQLFLQLAQKTHQLESQPEFYNTLFSNCTNELAKCANHIKPGAIPFNIGLFFTGFVDNLLYKQRLIPQDLTFTEIHKKYLISKIVKEIYLENDFSQKLRSYLN